MSFRLWVAKRDGVMEEVYLHPSQAQDPLQVRRVALSRSKQGERKVEITRDGKRVPGGLSGLDDLAYSRWVEDHPQDENDTGGLLAVSLDPC